MESISQRELVNAAVVLNLDKNKRIYRKDVKKAYRDAARDAHPDKSGGSSNAFNAVFQAYATLEQFFDQRGTHEPNTPESQTFQQTLHIDDMLFSPDEDAYYYQCRCSDLVEVTTVAMALGLTTYKCDTCSLGYRVMEETHQ